MKCELDNSMIQFNPTVFLSNHPVSVTVTIAPNNIVCEVYQINPHHRNGNPNKSQWTIGNHEEVEVFGWSVENESKTDEYYWGVLMDGAVCLPLGITPHRLSSKVARFECSAQPRVWHGYPVDYVNNPQHDCPGRDVLLKWATLGIITKSQIARLIGGRGWRD